MYTPSNGNTRDLFNESQFYSQKNIYGMTIFEKGEKNEFHGKFKTNEEAKASLMKYQAQPQLNYIYVKSPSIYDKLLFTPSQNTTV